MPMTFISISQQNRQLQRSTEHYHLYVSNTSKIQHIPTVFIISVNVIALSSLSQEGRHHSWSVFHGGERICRTNSQFLHV